MELSPLEFTAPTVIRATESTRMVKSITLHGHGQFRRIKVEETPLKESLKSDHVEVDVHYCGLNFTDNYLRLGIIRNRNFPVIMGSECSGIVTRVGSDVSDLEEGQKVLCLQMQGGLFRQTVHVPRKHVFFMPRETDLEDAVAIGLNFLVAHISLFEFGGVRAKHTIFMQSIAGGVGTAVIELARTIPMVKIYGTASKSKHTKLDKLKVDYVSLHEEDYVEAVLERHPEGLDIVINSNGGSDVEKCFKLLKRQGMLINIGSNSTAVYPHTKVWGVRPSWDSKYISSAELVSKNLGVAGLNLGLFLQTHSKLTQEILTEMFDLQSIGEIEPHVHSVLAFEKVVDGITQLCTRQNFGKIILDAKVESDERYQRVPEPGQPGSSRLEDTLKATLESAVDYSETAPQRKSE